MSKTQIFGINIDKLKYNDFFKSVTKLEKQTIIFTPNPEILLKAQSDKNFANLLNKATYKTPDGIGLYIAFQILNNNFGKIINTILIPYFVFNLFFRRKWLYKKFGERIHGSDLTKDLLKFFSKTNEKITIIDLYNPTDKKKVSSQKIFKKSLKTIFTKLDFDYFIYNPKEKDEIIKKIAKNNSKILFSTLGMEKQEKSIIEIMETCKNIKLGLAVGSSFDYIVGFQKRAPNFWGNIGLEWFYRLFTGPKKLNRLKRLWNAVFVFTFKVIFTKKGK